MARYVVVEFSDNSEAEAFIRDVNEQARCYRMDRLPLPRRIAGVFIKPGRTCGCPDWQRANYGDKNHQWAKILRGDKFGWWVCSRCNKPRKGGHQLRNQLPLSETYEGVIYEEYEFEVTSIDVTGIHRNQVDRPKKLRSKKEKK